MTLNESITKRVRQILSTSTRKRLASGAFWGGIANLGPRVITLLASFWLARILGQAGFGEYGMIYSTTGMISGLGGIGIGLTITKHVAEFRYTDPNKVGRILALSTIVTSGSAVICGAALVFLAPWIATTTLAAPHLAPMLQISAITVALGVVNNVQTSVLTGTESFRFISTTSVCTSLLQTTLVVIGAWQWQLTGAVLGMSGGTAITVLATRLVLRRELRKNNLHFQWREARQELRILINFSLPTFLTMATIGPGYWVCNAFLANQPDGYAELGLFNAATQWQGAIAFLPGLLGTALVPIMSQKIGSGDTIGSLSIMWRMMRMITWLVVPMAIAISLASPWILAGYGEAFKGGSLSIIILSLVAAITAIMYPISQYAIAANQMWQTFHINAASIAVMVLSSWIGARWGAEGLSFARLLSILVHSALFLLFARRQRISAEKRSILTA